MGRDFDDWPQMGGDGRLPFRIAMRDATAGSLSRRTGTANTPHLAEDTRPFILAR